MFLTLARLARIRNSGLAVGVVFLIAATSVACARGGSDLEERMKLLETSQNEMAAQLRTVTVEMDALTKGQLIAVLDLIDRADIHHIDDDLQEASQINPLYLGTVRKVKRAVTGTLWPTLLETEAEAFKTDLMEFEAALTDANLTASREAVRKAHLSYHALVDKGWKVVAGE